METMRNKQMVSASCVWNIWVQEGSWASGYLGPVGGVGGGSSLGLLVLTGNWKPGRCLGPENKLRA